MNSSLRKQAKLYFDKRVDALDYCNATFENKVRDEMKNITDSINSARIPSNGSDLYFDSELSKAITKLNYRIPSTFRNCMIVAACTLIEDFLLLIGTNALKDFVKKAKKVKNANGENQSQIRKYLQILKDEIPIDFTSIDNCTFQKNCD